jgi:hypothetical protein
MLELSMRTTPNQVRSARRRMHFGVPTSLIASRALLRTRVVRVGTRIGTAVARVPGMVFTTPAWHHGDRKCVIVLGGHTSNPIYSVRIVRNRTILRSQMVRSAEQAFRLADTWRTERRDTLADAAPAA